MSVTTPDPAATWLTPSRKVVAQTRARLGQTRSRIALNRRRLNPWWGVSGSSDDDGEDMLLQDVLDRLYRGVLAPAPATVRARRGTGQICGVCAQTIHADEVQNETAINDGGVTVKLWTHGGCLAIWQCATLVYVERIPSADDGHPA